MNDVIGANSVNEVLRVNAQRELEEEVGLLEANSQNLEYIGFINDDTNDVGKVHIGVVFKIKVNSNDIEVRETDTLKIQWLEKERIDNNDEFETWSALILKDYRGDTTCQTSSLFQNYNKNCIKILNHLITVNITKQYIN